MSWGQASSRCTRPGSGCLPSIQHHTKSRNVLRSGAGAGVGTGFEFLDTPTSNSSFADEREEARYIHLVRAKEVFSKSYLLDACEGTDVHSKLSKQDISGFSAWSSEVERRWLGYLHYQWQSMPSPLPVWQGVFIRGAWLWSSKLTDSRSKLKKIENNIRRLSGYLIRSEV